MHKTSVVIPTIYERKSDLYELIDHLMHQTSKPYEVIVVSDGAIKLPNKMAIRYRDCGMRLRLIRTKRYLTPGAHRNVGLKKARGTYIIFLDDDVLPTKRWLEEMKKTLEDGAELVGGLSKPLFTSGAKRPVWWDEALLGSYVAVGNEYVKFKHNRIWGCNLGIRKDVVGTIGYFDENLGPRKNRQKAYGEDVEFVMRAIRKNLAVVFNPHAIVYHKLDRRRLRLMYYKARAFQEGHSAKELSRCINSSITKTFFKSMFFKLLRGPYLVFSRKCNVRALPTFLTLLLYEAIGWLSSGSE